MSEIFGKIKGKLRRLSSTTTPPTTTELCEYTLYTITNNRNTTVTTTTTVIRLVHEFIRSVTVIVEIVVLSRDFNVFGADSLRSLE